MNEQDVPVIIKSTEVVERPETTYVDGGLPIAIARRTVSVITVSLVLPAVN